MASAALLAGAVALTYAGSVGGGFVSDDVAAIAGNPLLESLDAAHVRAIFASFDDANYIPLKVLSLAVDRALWGPQPFGHHLGNLLLHVVCALLVWRILLRFALTPGAALLVALLWALHPLQVESVAFMSERKNVLSGAFFFAAFLAYLQFARRGDWRAYAAVLALFTAALLSKMNTVVLPALCLAYETVVRRRGERRRLAATLPLFAIGAVVVWYNLAGNPIHGRRFHGGSAAVTWLTSGTVPFRYLARAAVPVGLRSFYYIPLHGSPADWPVALSLLGLTALAALVVRWHRRRPREAFWLLWFLITLAPMLNIVPFPTLMQDRYMYLPLLGVLAAPACALDAALRGAAARRAAAAVALAATAACGALTVARLPVWHDELSLWRDWAFTEWYLPVDRGPFRAEDSDRKLALLEAAARATPDAVVVRHNLGALRYERGDLPGAVAELEAAARLPGGDAGVPLLNLGRALLRSGDAAGAAAVLRRAVAREPYSFFAQLNLARAALQLGDAATARQALAACARIRPGSGQYQPEQAALEQLEQRRR
jgi:hypothetical protein